MLDQTDVLFGFSQRQPPHNMQAEQALLGALLANNLAAYERVSSFLEPEHFIDPIHQNIYRAIKDRVEAGRLADAVTLKAELGQSGKLDEVGGAKYLSHLLAAMVGIINASEYGRVIHDAWLRREMIRVGEDIVNESFSETDTPKELYERQSAALDRIYSRSNGKLSISFADAATLAIERSGLAFDNEGYIGCRTGFSQLDRMLGGLERGAVYFFAARPGMGKTSAALQVADGMATASNQPVMFRSLEMSAEQLLMRCLSMETGIPLTAIRSGEWKAQKSPVEWTRAIGDAAKSFQKKGILINDQGAQSIEEIGSEARSIKRKHGTLGGIVIDYLQIMRPPKAAEKFGLTEQTTALSIGLKSLAKQLECPLVVLSQLSRANEGREDKRPQLSDLRQSGALEQDAEAVIGLYRHEYYVERTKPSREPGDSDSDFQIRMQAWLDTMKSCTGQAEWLVLKNRNGPTGMIEMRWDSQHTAYSEPHQ